MSKSVIKIQTFSVYTSTTLVLLLLGAMCALLFSAKALSEHIRNNMTMSVVVSAKLDDGEIEKFRTQLAKRKYVIDTKYISSAEILEEQKIELGADPVEFLGYNPYEPSIELTLKSEYTHIDSMANIEKARLKDKRVSQVLYHREIIDTVNNNINKIAIALLAFMVILTLISWSLIGNLVRLSIYSKRFLLHTMKLVGATWGFIRRPFLLHNMWIGLAAGVIANALLGTAIYMIQQRAPEMALLLPMKELAVVGGAVMLFGITICTLCAFQSVNRFLRMRNNDLYFI